MSELIREALGQYQQRQEMLVNNDLIATLRAIQEEARKAGLDKLSSREIDQEIAAVRKERKNKQPTK